MKAKIFSTLTIMLTCFTLSAHALVYQQKETNTIFDMPPFERAVCVIKYYEGMHRKKDYPYVGYGHKLRPGEHYSYRMSLTQADKLLRADLRQLCDFFSKYGKDSLLLAVLAYNVGPYKIIGRKGKIMKSRLMEKIESGVRDFKSDYVEFCNWKGKKIDSIERRRYAEYQLLYVH